MKKQLKRTQVLPFFANLRACRIGMEACDSAHYWARKLQALGHTVQLIPPQYVKPFVKRNKNDAARYRWSPQAEEKSYRHFTKGIEIGMRLAAMDRVLAKFTKIWKWSAEQLAELLSPTGDAGWAATPALARRSANLADNASEAPLVTPVIDSENEKLFITLHFAQGVPTIPRSKDSIHLYIDGTPVENFSVAVIEERGETSLDLEVPLDTAYAQQHSRMACEVHCNPDDLSEMAVVMTTC